MWFDYVHLSDDERDEAFKRAYLDAYRHFYAKRTDRASARNRGSVKKGGAITKARQAADALSIPYDRYCVYAISVSEECQWKHLAQPNQLYSEAMQALILDRWEAENKYFLTLPESPCSTPEYHAYLKSAIEDRSNPQQLVYDLLRCGKLSWQTAQEIFSQSMLDRVRELEVVCGAVSA